MFARFMSYVMPEPNSGCWLWLGATNPNGYGKLSIGSTHGNLAHRTSWLLHRGAIPAGMYILHRCDTRCCVNPDHLRVGTPQENKRDAINRNRIPKTYRQRRDKGIKRGSK